MAADLFNNVLASEFTFISHKQASCNFIVHVLIINIYCSVKNGTRVMRNVKWSHNLKKTVCILLLHRLDPFKVQFWQYCLYKPLHYLWIDGESFNILEKMIFQRYGMAVWKDFCFYCYEKNLSFFLMWLSVHLSVHSCNSQFQYPANKNVLGNFDFPWNKIYQVCLCRCWLWLHISMLLFWHTKHKKFHRLFFSRYHL